MIASLIGAIVVAIGVIGHSIWSAMTAQKKENQVLKAKETSHEAKEIVAKKSDDELVDDFNSRWKDDGGSGSGAS